MASAPNIPNIDEYHQHFNQNLPFIKQQPREDRSCNDKCCYAFFILLTLLFIAGGIYYIASADFASFGKIDTTTKTSTIRFNAKSNIDTYDISNLKPGIPIILGMIAFALVLAILFLVLLVKFPKCVFYAMLFLGGLLLLGLAILLFSFQQYVGGGIILFVFLLYLLFLYCSREQIRVGIVLLETAATFIAEKPSVIIAPFSILLIVIVFQVFWLTSLVGISLHTGNSKTQQQLETQQSIDGFFVILWMVVQIFYSFIFYYCSVFLIATAAAMWYYNVIGNYLFTAFKRIITNHLGSFTFASLIMTIVTIAKSSAEKKYKENSGGAAICYCIIACCLKSIQSLLEVLNHNAIIVMAVTGEDYIDSAKSAISLIFDNFSLFYLIDSVSGLLTLSGIVFICALPGIIGFLLLQKTAQNPDDVNYLTFGTFIIVLAAILMGCIFLSALSQALSCIFIFYCLDRKLIKSGYNTVQNIPPTMKKLFEQMGKSGGDHYQGGNHPVNSRPALQERVSNNPQESRIPSQNFSSGSNQNPAYPYANNSPGNPPVSQNNNYYQSGNKYYQPVNQRNSGYPNI